MHLRTNLVLGSNRKMAIKKLRITRLKNKTWTNPQIKNHKKTKYRHNIKKRTNVFNILNTTNISFGEKLCIFIGSS